jgi:ribosome-binding factor A
MPSIRQARVGERIKRDLAEILQKEMRDPKLAMVSITNVEVTRDFAIARVFVSAIGTPEEKTAALKGLWNAAGFLRGRLGAVLKLRVVPELQFRQDTGIENGIRIFELLKSEEAFMAQIPPEDIVEPEEAGETS